MLEVKKPFVMQYISRNDPFRHWATLEQRRQRVTSIAIIKEILEFPKNNCLQVTVIQDVLLIANVHPIIGIIIGGFSGASCNPRKQVA